MSLRRKIVESHGIEEDVEVLCPCNELAGFAADANVTDLHILV